MNIEHLRYYVEIVKSNYNLTVAAKKLYISQSALSQLINHYENLINVPFFKRNKGHLVGLTPAGKYIFQKSQSIINIYEETKKTLQNVYATNKQITIGIPILALQLVYEKFFQKLQLEYQNLKISIIESNSQKALYMLNNGEIDIAISTENPNTCNDLFSKKIFDSDLVVIMDRNHPLAKNKFITAKDLFIYPLASLNNSYDINKLIIKKFKSIKSTPVFTFQSSDLNLLISTCKNQKTLAILPTLAYSHVNKNEYCYKLMKPDIRFSIYISILKKYKRFDAKNFQIFIDMCKYAENFKEKNKEYDIYT
ncbi:LysR family transcriptional regulator [Bombilactobacillus bombi]|uniref:LysR family transcriptional regulator n=1 Tax=Bombilactobacillus bombi TaxID=1303590 RepID=UPI000E57DFA1|nr:LysR family transcriptional regulator [Bombilactobacillus bombi]AXX65418.1 LysR family transcriptional regulator [Bombilactobacillus bombi]